MNQRKGDVVEEQFQGRHQDPGPGLWRYHQDEACVKKPFSLSRPKLCATLYGLSLFLTFFSSGLCVLKKLSTLACDVMLLESSSVYGSYYVEFFV